MKLQDEPSGLCQICNGGTFTQCRNENDNNRLTHQLILPNVVTHNTCRVTQRPQGISFSRLSAMSSSIVNILTQPKMAESAFYNVIVSIVIVKIKY